MTKDSLEPLVSVIIPVYNSEKYLKRAIESALNQTYKHFEIIVVDDGSVDTSRTILESYDDLITYIYQDNAGASSARNTGIKHSKGELIAFLDSDDLWYPEKLRAQVNAYLNEPEAALIHTAVDKQEEFHGVLPVCNKDLKARHKSFLEVFKQPNLKTPSVMIPKKVFDQIGGFNTSLVTAEDQDIFLRCCYEKLVLYIPQKLVYCSVFSGSLCDNLCSYEDNIKVIDMFVAREPDFLVKNGQLVNQRKSIIYREYADDLCYQGELARARSAAIMSIKYDFTFSAVILYFKTYIKQFFTSGVKNG